MSFRHLRFCCLLAASALPSPAQIKISYGEIAGAVLDPDGRRIPNAAVTVSDGSRGFRRAANAGGAGEYRVPMLPPGRYSVEFQAAGFAPLQVEGIAVRVGESVGLDAAMKLGESSSSITVGAAPAAVEAARVHQAGWLESERIESLPINRRNYLDFALLSPGVVETNGIVDSADYRVVSVPHSGLGILGGDGSGNTFAIDGFNNSGVTGNMRPSVPQAAVQEFQVNRATYSAEFGGAVGGAVNIVTRSGTDRLHGEAFGFLRQRDFQARNYFDPGKAAFTRVQSGASAGGPVRRERSFWFAAVERLDRHESAIVPISSDPAALSRLTPSQEQLLGFMERSGPGLLSAMAAGLRPALTPTSNPLVLPLFAANSGVFPFAAHSTQAVARFDWRPSQRNSLFARINFTALEEQNSKLGAQFAYSRGSSLEFLDNTDALQFLHVFSPRWVSDTRLGFGYSRFSGLPNDPTGPAIDIGGYGSFGRDTQFPADTRTRHVQLLQTFTWLQGGHAVKFGADINPTLNSVGPQLYQGGRFVFGAYIPLYFLINAASGISTFSTGLASAFINGGQPALAAALSQPITALQAFGLGLPVAYAQSFGNTMYRAWQQHYSAFIEDNWRPAAGLTVSAGLRWQTDVTALLPTARNFSPRFGFAWSPRQGKSVVRGGYSLMQAFSGFEVPYAGWSPQRPDLTFAFIPLTGISVTNPLTWQPLNSADIYQALRQKEVIGKRPIRIEDLAPLGVPAGYRFANTGGIGPDFVNPYAHQAALEVEGSAAGFALSAAWNFSRTLHLPRIRDVNVVRAGTRPDGWPLLAKADPALDFLHWIESAANADYNALVLQVRRRFHRNWSLNAHYTWSKTMDEVLDLTPDYTPHNTLDARADRSLSSYHQGRRFVADLVFRSPAASRSPLWRDWTVSAIWQANSARPFNLVTGTDNMGDGKVTTHRPLGLGRNAGTGPAYLGADLRISRSLLPRRESGFRVDVVAEVFNVLNRTNFECINNIVGDVTLASLPASLTGRRGDPAEPLSFTSARDPRQFQFGLKLGF